MRIHEVGEGGGSCGERQEAWLFFGLAWRWANAFTRLGTHHVWRASPPTAERLASWSPTLSSAPPLRSSATMSAETIARWNAIPLARPESEQEASQATKVLFAPF